MISNQLYPCWNPDQYRDQKGTYDGSDMTKAYNFKVEHTKTIYDPSPVRFIVPNSGLLQMLNGNTPFTYSTTAKDADVKTFTARVPHITSNSGLNFYLDGYYGGSISDYKSYDYLWTAGIYSSGANASYGKAGNSSSPQVQITPAAKAVTQALPVRPIVNALKDQVQKGRYYREGVVTNVPVEWIKTNTSGSYPVYYHGIKDLTTVIFTINGKRISLKDIVDNPKIENVKVYTQKEHYQSVWLRTALLQLSSPLIATLASEVSIRRHRAKAVRL